MPRLKQRRRADSSHLLRLNRPSNGFDLLKAFQSFEMQVWSSLPMDIIFGVWRLPFSRGQWSALLLHRNRKRQQWIGAFEEITILLAMIWKNFLTLAEWSRLVFVPGIGLSSFPARLPIPMPRPILRPGSNRLGRSQLLCQ